VWKKTRMMWMVKKLKICLFVLTEFTNVTDDRRTDKQTDEYRMTA